jgi:hypothetical protein
MESVRRCGAWIGRWNPLVHALVAAIVVDLAVDVAFGNGNVNVTAFSSTFLAGLVVSIMLQRRAAKRILAGQPVYPAAPIDSDGTPFGARHDRLDGSEVRRAQGVAVGATTR